MSVTLSDGRRFLQVMKRYCIDYVNVGDQAVTERRYRITAEGRKRWSEARAFYEHVARAATKLRWSDA